MSSIILANLEALEGTINGTELLTLTLASRRLTITNDSATKTLKYKFNSSESYATLKPTETLSLDFITRTIYIQGSGVDYRIWSYA